MSKINKIFWIDSMDYHEDIEKIISTNYLKKLEFFSFKNLKNAFDEISKINFEIIFVVLRGSLYQDYYSILNNVKYRLTCLPISIIYNSNNSINLNSKNFYGFIGTITSREKLILLIRDFINSVNSKIKLNPKTGVTIDYNNTLTFEKMKNLDDLIIPSLYDLYKKIEGKENIINDEDIYKFNNILVNNHFYNSISELIIPLNDVKNIPLEIATKFWIRYYTSESSFYPYMNTQLMKNKPENYEIFVKAMYKGIEKKYLQSEYNVRLYRCQLISKSEIDILEANLILVYSRAFLSFSKDKHRAINFLKKGNNHLTPVMFIVNTINLEEAFSSNAEVEQYSIYRSEKEVLFFPFSSFIVDEKIKTQIINGIETKIIYLNYLGKYREEIERKINTLDENKIKELLSKDSKFVKDISSIKLNEDKIKQNQIELKKAIQKAVNKVKEETLIKWKSEEKNKNCEIINPFKILGISEDEKIYYPLIDDFEKKIKNDKYFLSCFVLDNKENYSRIDNNFLINKDAFYYVIKNDLNNLKKLYEENKFILAQKDNIKRTLLHYSVIGRNYEISEFLLKNGINYDEPDFSEQQCPSTALYYADEKHRELLKKFGAKIERYNMGNYNLSGINSIKPNDINIIDSLYEDLLKKQIVEKMIDIKKNDEVIGKKLIRSKNLIECEEILNKYEKVYHGTRFVSIEFILNYGLQNFGDPLKNHIHLGLKNDNIDDWANAIFVSPSIFYASKYSELISYKNEEWFILIEARIKPDSFSIHESTIYGYQFKTNEPKNVEYRIKCSPIIERLIDHNIYERSDIIVTSLILIKKKFLDNIKDYSEGDILKNN